MKVMHQFFLIIALTCMAFIAVTFFNEVRFPLMIYIPTTILFSLIILGLTRFFLVKHISSLEQKLQQMKNTVYASEEKLQLHAQTHSQNLEKLNNQLKQKISEHDLAEHRPNTNNEHITQLAQYDELTSLPNRIFFNETLNKTLKHAKRRDKICAVLIINIDSFKEININLGHKNGDLILKEIAKRFSATLRSEDLLARLDGDEFIVLLNDIGKSKFASAVAEKLLVACARPITIGSQELTLTASIGISIYPNDGESLEDLLKKVDTALYKAKHNGKGTYQFYTHEMDIEAREYIKLETALRKAIQNNELTLYYQPKLHIKRGSLAGVEALLRWDHPEFGLISPAKFIPIAEETGLIMQIGEWALREACKINKYWQDEGYEHFTIAVNLSPKEFNNPDIAQIIETILTETGLNPNYLELEINEKTVMDNISTSKNILDKIKEKGVQISIDHFGVGYTSISQLKQLPINAVKIDQLYIKGIPLNPDDLVITNALIALVRNLGLEVVAEGVETAEQVQYLADQNCDVVQGYYLSHPVPAQKIVLQFKKLMDEIII